MQINEKIISIFLLNYYVKDRISKDNKNYIIVLSSNFIEQGVSISADIEDGYLCALKDI